MHWFTTGELRDRPLIAAAEQVVRTSSTRVFEPPMILMAIYGSPTVGRLGWVTQPCSCNQAALGLRSRSEDGHEWLWHKLEELRGHFNSMAQGAAQQNISKEKVQNTLVAVPPAGVLQRFADVARPLRDSSHRLAVVNARIAALRDLVLARLVSGRLDISGVDLGALLAKDAA